MSGTSEPIIYDAQTLLQAFPSAIHADIRAAVSSFAFFTRRSYQSCQFSAIVLGERVLIPERLLLSGFSFPFQPRSTGGLAKACLRTRSTDGFERQKALRKIITINEPWTVPFVIALVGDYVIDILNDISAHVNRFDRILFADFLQNSPEFYCRVKQQTVSYWNAYYRHIPKSEYVGFQILTALDEMVRDSAGTQMRAY